MLDKNLYYNNRIYLELSANMDFTINGEIENVTSYEGTIMLKSPNNIENRRIGSIEWHLFNFNLYKHGYINQISEIRLLDTALRGFYKKNNLTVLPVIYITFLTIDNDFKDKGIDLFIIEKLVQFYYPKFKSIALKLDFTDFDAADNKLHHKNRNKMISEGYISLSDDIVYKNKTLLPQVRDNVM